MLEERQTLARLGGEEFGILLPDCDAPKAREIAERLRRLVEEWVVPLAIGPLRVTISVGGACEHAQVADLDALLLRADHALYAAKRAGRNTVHFAEL